MRIQVMLLFTLFHYNNCLSQTEFFKPWKNSNNPIVIDVYKGNDYNVNFIKKDTRIKAIIHKLSEEDSTIFYKRRAEAYNNNFLFGSYWLPKFDSNGTVQADLYLKMIKYSFTNKEFIALDFERHKLTKQFISPYNSYLFVRRIFEKTGRYPHLYCGLDNLNKLMKSEYNETFKKCKLWIIALPEDGNISNIFANNKIWKTYSLWQFSCELNCCKGSKKPCNYKVNGIDCYMDYDIFNGTYNQLIIEWRK
jgi:GH25 family lysozyme M1 (1,4-beta-N-acetylmuramidase)